MTATDDNGESWEFTHTYIAQGEKIIAQVQQQSKSQGWPTVQSVDEMWANARLICAGPDMLAALEELCADKYLADPINADRMANALAAIAKVKGGDA
jgi:hypothetical protein